MNKVGALLFLTTVFLTIIGIFILYESSTYTALLNLGDKYSFVRNQIIWAILGIVCCFVVSRIDYKKLYILSLPFLLGTIGLLLLVFLEKEIKGAHRWIYLGFFTLQPSEVLKISLTLYLAAWLSNKESGRVVAFLILFLSCVFLVAIEPDLGTAFIIASTSIIVYFLSGSPIKDMFVIFLILIGGIFLLIKMEPYRIARLSAFQQFNSKDLSTTSYHVKQILIAVGSGGLTGVGFGKSIQKYAYLPESTTDSIFAIYAEETGLLGCLFLFFVFVLQLVLGFLIAIRNNDKFGRILAAGIITFIGIQTVVNLGSQVVLVPLTGVPLPFISYGGSSMIINYVSIGILLSVSRYS